MIALASVLALCGLAFAWWSARQPPGRAPAAPETPRTIAATADLAAGDRPSERAPQAAQARAQDPEPDAARFAGRGRIRGEVTAVGVALPDTWTLVLEPHPFLAGSARAQARRREVRGDGRFDERDLPLGGYSVRAEAAGLNSTREPVLLVRGSSDVHVTLALRAAGFVDGIVRDEHGRGAEGLEVVLESADSGDRRTARVDAAGAFLFADVVDGEYRILFGAPERPLVPPGDLRFRAPSLRWPTVDLPPTARLCVRVRDERGVPVPGAQVSGSGTPHGVARGETGADGSVLLAWLWPARYRVTAKAADGRTGRATAQAAAGETGEVEVRVR